MIIVVNPSGNHSNRLFQAIHLEAFAIENKCRYYNPTFSEMGRYFNIKKNLFDFVFDFIFRKLRTRLRLKIHDFSEEYFNQHAPSFLILKKNIAFVSGWFFFQKSLTLKYKAYFRQKYSLSPEIIEKIMVDEKCNFREIREMMQSYEVVLGVHIRRGDYKEWENGKYYYNDNVYKAAISQTRNLFKSTKVLILLFSNDHISFNNNDNTILSNNEWYIDHYLMGLCDYLIGPPSTFSLWATYIGPKVKYYHINNQFDFPKSIEEFQEYNG